MVFTVLNGWGKVKRRIIFPDTWKWCDIPNSVSINEMSLGHNHIHLFTYRQWPLCCSSSRAEQLWQPIEPANIYYLTLHWRSLPTLDQGHKRYLFPGRRDRGQNWHFTGHGVRTAVPEGSGSNADLDSFSFQQGGSRSSRREGLTIHCIASRK